MKAKSEKSKKNQKKDESQKQKKNKEKKISKEDNMEQKQETIENKSNNSSSTNNELSQNKNKKISPWVFLQNNDLQGFHTAFILMIILPISVFFIIRNILSKYNFSKNQQNVYGVVGVLISVWLILVSYIIYYFRNDFYVVCCKKKEKGKEKDKNE